MKHVVRDEGDAWFPFSTSVFKYATPWLHCGACHVYVKPKLIALWGLSRKVKPKFTEEESSLKNHTLVERRGKTFNDGPIHQNWPSQELVRFRFVPWHRWSMKRSLFPGDVSASRRTEVKFCYSFFYFFVTRKFLKKNTKKGDEDGVDFVASSRVRLQLWSTLALHVCYRQVQRRQKGASLAFFFELWFRLADERLCNWWCEAELWALFLATSTKIASPFVLTDSIFPGGAPTQGVNCATGSTGVDVNM